MPSISLIVKIVGWLFVAVPLGLFLFISATMFIGVAKEDSLVQVLVFVFSSVFLIGAGMLALAYGTSLLAAL
ncbi:hypothetical protein EPO34_01005 [Patescibacteria group bacterium]|nr:MAG: hypothetical protein EPO34_01005 [Patescibacteria group bacterium]